MISLDRASAWLTLLQKAVLVGTGIWFAIVTWQVPLDESLRYLKIAMAVGLGSAALNVLVFAALTVARKRWPK